MYLPNEYTSRGMISTGRRRVSADGQYTSLRTTVRPNQLASLGAWCRRARASVAPSFPRFSHALAAPKLALRALAEPQGLGSSHTLFLWLTGSRAPTQQRHITTITSTGQHMNQADSGRGPAFRSETRRAQATATATATALSAPDVLLPVPLWGMGDTAA